MSRRPDGARALAANLAAALDPAAVMTVAGMTPDPWQAALLRETHEKRALLNCSRQAGKSTATAACAVWTALQQPGSLTLLISPSMPQSAELLRRVMELLRKQPGAPAVVAESQKAVELANGSRVVSVPAVEESLRGYSPQLLVLDEAASLPDETFAAARPMLSVTAGRMLVLSTPRGKRGFFFEAFTGPGNWRRFRVTADECSRISREYLDQERDTLGPMQFRAEYFCSFEDSGQAVFDYDDVHAALDDTIEPLFALGRPRAA